MTKLEVLRSTAWGKAKDLRERAEKLPPSREVSFAVMHIDNALVLRDTPLDCHDKYLHELVLAEAWLSVAPQWVEVTSVETLKKEEDK